MEATSLHDFNTTEPDELPFKKGSVVKVCNGDGPTLTQDFNLVFGSDCGWLA